MYKFDGQLKTGYVLALMRDDKVIEIIYKPPKPTDVGMEYHNKLDSIYKEQKRNLKKKRQELANLGGSDVFSIRAGSVRVIEGAYFFVASKEVLKNNLNTA